MRYVLPMDFLRSWGHRNAGGGAPVAGTPLEPGGMAGMHLIDLDREMAGRAGMTRAGGEAPMRLPPIGSTWAEFEEQDMEDPLPALSQFQSAHMM